MLMRTLAPVLVCQLSGLALSGAYRGMWRYTGLADILRLARGITVGTVASVLYLLFTTRFVGLSRAVFVLDWLLLAALVGASRAVLPAARRGAPRAPRAGARPVLVYGAGDGGELALRELRNNPALGARGRGVHRRRPGEGGHADPRRARARTARRARGAAPDPSGRGGRRRLAQDSRPSGSAGSRRRARARRGRRCEPPCGSSERSAPRTGGGFLTPREAAVNNGAAMTDRAPLAPRRRA